MPGSVGVSELKTVSKKVGQDETTAKENRSGSLQRETFQKEITQRDTQEKAIRRSTYFF